MKIAVSMKEDWFPFIQRTFHVALAGFRLTLQSAWYIRPFTELIRLIAPILTKLQLTYYLNLISKDLVYYARHIWEHSFETIKALHELFSTVRIFFLEISKCSLTRRTQVSLLAISNPLVTSRILQNLLDFESEVEIALIKSEDTDKLPLFEHVSVSSQVNPP
jgi:hypothetical protein